MNILHNRFAGLWRQDLSQNVTTKEIEKRSRYSSLFFDIFWWSVFTFIRSRNGPNTYFPESFARSHQSLLTMSNPFISFTSLSVPEKQSVFLLACVCYQKLSHYNTTMTQGNPTKFSHKRLRPKWMTVSYSVRNISLETWKSTINAISYRLHSRKYW